MKKISNPLTIIGLFAGTAEVAGTVVLPFVSSELQKFFIWYVMGFPFFLVILFFVTLNRNTKVLYAPSDFIDENNFMKLITDASINVTNIIEKNPSVEKELKPVETLIEKLAIENPGIDKVDIYENSVVNAYGLDCKGFLIHNTKEFLLQEHVIIGRSEKSDIVLNDPSVSRFHCEINFIQGKYFIKDFNTSNGILINGKKIAGNSYFELKDNSIIKIGRVKFVFKYNTLK